MKINFSFPKIKVKKYKKAILKKIESVLNKGVFLNGSENQKLTQYLRAYLGAGHVMVTASGHDAILLALQSLKLTPNDEILFPVNVYPTAFPIAQSKAKLIPIDVDENGLINLKEVTKNIHQKTKALITVHLYGLTVQMDQLKNILYGKDIVLIEDCAQAFGSIYKNKPVGLYGDIACFSFYPTKNLGAVGDGGAIWTQNKDRFQYFQKAVAYGESKKYASEFIAGHSRMPEIQAAVLNLYLKNFEKELILRQKVFQLYQDLFITYNLLSYARILYSDIDANSPNWRVKPAMHLFVVEAKNRDALASYLQKKGIATLIHYPTPIHLLPAFAYLGYKKGSFPVAEKLSNAILSLPFHPYLSKNQVEYVVESMHSFYYG